MAERLSKSERRAQILQAAVTLAEKVGYMQIQRADVAKAAGIVPARVSQLFNTMPQLRRAVMRCAIRTNNCTVICQGLSIGDKQALKLSPNQRYAAIQALVKATCK